MLSSQTDNHDESVVEYFINAVSGSSDYNIGNALWDSISPKQKEMVVEWRKKACLLDSVGNSCSICPLTTTDSAIKPPRSYCVSLSEIDRWLGSLETILGQL